MFALYINLAIASVFQRVVVEELEVVDGKAGLNEMKKKAISLNVLRRLLQNILTQHSTGQ